MTAMTTRQWKWGLLVLCSGFGLPAIPAAQDLENGDFEKALSGGSVPNWGWNWGSPGGSVQTTLLSAASDPASVFCGSQSLKLTVPSTGYYEFGKTWPTSSGSGVPITAKVRLRLSHAGMSSKVKLVAYAFNPNPPQPPWYHGTKNETLLAATTDWQELTIAHTTSTNRSYQLRLGLEMNGITPTEHVVLDYVVFGGSSPMLNGGLFPDHVVVGVP
jgi:hypothetical protein